MPIAEPTPSPTTPSVKAIAKLHLVLAVLGMSLVGASEGAIGVVLPNLGADYGVEKAIAVLPFVSASIGYITASLNSGFLARKLGNFGFFLVGVASFSVGTGAMGLHPPLALLLVVPFAIGFGAAIVEASTNAFVAKFANNAALLNILHAGFGTGAFFAPIVGTTILAQGGDWPAIYVLLASSAALLGLGLYFGFDRGNYSTPNNGAGNERAALAALKYPIVAIAGGFLVVYIGVEMTVGNWGYTFLTEARQLDPLRSGWLISGYWLGVTVGRLAILPLGTRVGNRRLIEGCLVGGLAGVLLAWLVAADSAAAIGLFLTGFCLGPILPTTFAIVANRIPSHLFLVAASLIASAWNLGKSAFPWLAGVLVDRFSLAAFFPYVVALFAVVGLLWLQLRSQLD